jgi:hypothetical protein
VFFPGNNGRTTIDTLQVTNSDNYNSNDGAPLATVYVSCNTGNISNIDLRGNVVRNEVNSTGVLVHGALYAVGRQGPIQIMNG